MTARRGRIASTRATLNIDGPYYSVQRLKTVVRLSIGDGQTTAIPIELTLMDVRDLRRLLDEVEPLLVAGCN